ncbi:GNAT family N-acetyltransferase [Providencia vermicola]|uniref:GNAT family N-acetyltransferase n=1 Tax=Providencia vermicola TaxID=333965 RepID=A0AAX3S369_9GAMM|nr:MULTISPECIES: GNAT family N-acetyltransferase [Providencia]ELX8380768.1 GNAT family N-acetyltransferase [Providencia stuartii]EMD5260306.1 GNAT family N-acetyltransferase [Providencia stuartii]USB38637.1 GNAT family N-acetyltransferase [Providencia vermicola]WFC07695.1 GNAT family N-acetyltransferase [Providencia vermicola]
MQVKYSVGYAYPELVNHAFQLRQQVFTHEQGFPADIDVDECDDNALHVVLYIDHTPVAVLRCILHPHKVIKVGRVAVLKQHRGKGLGRKLMTFVEQYAKEHQFQSIELSAQHTAIAFYEALGYHTQGDSYDEDGMAHIYMVLSLT